MDFYLYMGLEVGGCSLFADPSGYVGRRTHYLGEVAGMLYVRLSRLQGTWPTMILTIALFLPFIRVRYSSTRPAL